LCRVDVRGTSCGRFGLQISPLGQERFCLCIWLNSCDARRDARHWVVRLYDNRRRLFGFRKWRWQDWDSGGWFFVVGLVSDLFINDFL
jgi:hypothetical protein